MRSASLGLGLLGLLVLVSCRSESESAGQTGSSHVNDAGMCVRDHEVLDDLLVHPQSCNATAECPVGAFCRTATGTCDWSCFSDSDCGLGTCDCDGRCQASDAPDAGVGVDPTCARDPDRLAGLGTAPESCVLDEDCPFGAHCGGTSRLCEASCLGNIDCTAGEVCDCDGRCALPGAEPPPIADVWRVEASPIDLTVLVGPDGRWGPRRLEVSMRAPRSAGTDAPPMVRVAASPGLRVSCTDSPVGPWADHCDLAAWQLTPGLELSTPMRIWVAPGPDFVPGDHWEVTLLGETGRMVVPQTVAIGIWTHADLAIDPLPRDGVYRGAVELIGADDVPVASVPVDAWINGAGQIELLDVAGSLAVDGKLRLAPGGSVQARWLATDDGALTATVTASAIVHHPAAGVVTGDFTVALPLGGEGATLTYRFRLTRTEAATSCAAGCVGGETCAEDFGLCTAGAPWAPATSAANQIHDAELAAWTTNLDTLSAFTRGGQEQVIQFPFSTTHQGFADLYVGADVYGGASGVASATLSAHRPIANAHLLVEYAPLPDLGGVFDHFQAPRDRGRQLCRQSLDAYVAWLNLQPGVAAHLFRWDSGTSTAGFCDQLYDSAGTYASNRFDELLPCVDDATWSWDPWDGHLASLPTTRSASCQRVAGNYQAATGELIDYATFLRDRCIDVTPVELRLLRNGTWDVHPIHLCPWQEPLLGPLDGRSNAERLLCYADEDAPVHLTSERLGAQRLASSGDLACSGGAEPHGVELAYHADRADPAGVAETAQTCLAELQQDLPVLGDLFGRATLAAAYDDSFAPGRCFSAGPFYPAIDALVSGDGTEADVRLLQRLLQQWLGLHVFLAREGGDQDLLTRVLRDASGDPLQRDADAAPELGEFLEAVERGWELVLDADVVTALLAAPASAIASPDYRAAGPLDVDDEQPTGLPVALVDAAAMHLQLVERLAVTAALEAYGQCYSGGTSTVAVATRRRIGVGMRDAATAEALASTLAARAPGAGWTAQLDNARRQLIAVRARLVATAARLARCEHPLGIAEGQVPLYFGDVVGDSSRFFAASDYLIEAWARPVVASARGALGEARSAWLSQRDSLIGDTLREQDADRRREQLAASYGREVVSLCGLDEVESQLALDAVGDAPGQLSPEACHLAPDPSCQLAAADVFAAVTDDHIKFQLCTWTMMNPGEHVVSADQQARAANWSSAYNNGGGRYVVSGRTYPLAEIYERMPDVQASPFYGVSIISCTARLGFTLLDMPPVATAPASCYRGDLGEAALVVKSAYDDVSVATARWDDAQRDFERQSERCVELEEHVAGNMGIRGLHREHMRKLRNKRAAAQARSSWLSGAFGVATMAFGAMTSNPLAVLGGFQQVAGSLISRGSTDFDRKFVEADEAYQDVIQGRSEELGLRDCWREVDATYQAIDNAALEVKAALGRADLALTQFHNDRAQLRQVLLDGRAALAREANRTVPKLGFHYWLDERLDRFGDELTWARTLTYLAMLAVEYEFQATLDLRSEILAATHPDQLEDVVLALEQIRLGRTINGRRPEDGSLVLSLRDDILALDDLTPIVGGDRDSTAVERLQERLVDPSYAVHGDDGTYLGQGIPFTLAPQGPLELRCAERLWRVTATIQGDLLDVEAPSAHLLLVKRSHFASQWCDDHGDGTTSQGGSLLPPSQLAAPGGHGGEQAAGLPYVSAMLEPYFNVPRSQLYADAFTEGGSEELAGQGLYGEYILLLPWHGLLAPTGGADAGFPLERVEDVLIRFDHLSVDDLGGL